MLNPPATAESIENPATETIKKRFPATTETMTKNNDGNHKQNVSCDDGNHKKQPTTETITKNVGMMSTMETININVLTVSVTNSVYTYRYI